MQFGGFAGFDAFAVCLTAESDEGEHDPSCGCAIAFAGAEKKRRNILLKCVDLSDRLWYNKNQGD